MMSHKSKRELLDTVRPRYYKATRPEKKRILDEWVAITGYHRKYLIHVLRHPSQSHQRRKRRGKRCYTLPVKAALIQVWRVANCICSKRPVPCMEEFVTALGRHEELQLDAQTRQLVMLQLKVHTVVTAKIS